MTKDTKSFENFWDNLPPTEILVKAKSLSFYGTKSHDGMLVVYIKFDVKDVEKWQSIFGANDDGINKSGNFIFFVYI